MTQNNQDLLAEIFGNSASPSPSTMSPPAQSQKSTVDDILGLFGSSGPVATPVSTHTPPSNISSAFSLPQTQSPPPPPPQATPRLTSYTAYEKNELKVTLTPQTSAARPGVVVILARFQTTGGSPVTGLNFQAAVPKVFPNLTIIKSSYNADVSSHSQSQQLQMLPMSSPDVNPGAVETQQMRVVAPVGVRCSLVSS